MSRISLLFGVILLTGGVLLGAALLMTGGDVLRQGGLARLTYHGGPLLTLQSPEPGEELPAGGVEVLVRFPDRKRVASQTFRCLLNGEDVTHLLTVGQNGAAGSVYPLREGGNQIEVQVFGRGWYRSHYFMDRIEVPVQISVPLMDRA